MPSFDAKGLVFPRDAKSLDRYLASYGVPRSARRSCIKSVQASPADDLTPGATTPPASDISAFLKLLQG